MSIKNFLLGDTAIFKWVNTISAMSPYLSVYNGSDALVSSLSMTDSGNGYYWAGYITTSPGYYVGKMTGWVNSYPFTRQQTIKVVTGQVD